MATYKRLASTEPTRRQAKAWPAWLAQGKVLALLTIAGVALISEGSAAAQRIGIRSGPPPTATLGKHCLGDQEQKLTLEHYMVGGINPLGLENQLRLALCTPFVEKPGLLYDFTNFEFGLANYISPTHVHGGLFGALTPLSILTLKAEVTGFYIWPLGSVFPGAGVFPLADQTTCTASYTNDLYPPAGVQGPPTSDGYGIRTLLGASLQGSVPLGKRLDLLAYNGFNAEYWRYNTDKCIFVARRDVGIHGSGDWILANTSVLALAIKITPNHTLRIGATNDLVYTPFNGYLGNVAAGLISFGMNNLRNLAKAFAVFIRLGGFTSGFRVGTGMTLAGGLDVTYELAKRPTRRAAQINSETPPAPDPALATPPSDPSAPPPPVVTPDPSAPAGTAAPAPAGDAR